MATTINMKLAGATKEVCNAAMQKIFGFPVTLKSTSGRSGATSYLVMRATTGGGEEQKETILIDYTDEHGEKKRAVLAPLTGNIGKYLQNFKKMPMSEDEYISLYKQNNPDYVSQSLVKNMFSNEYDEVEVDSIKNIMKTYNHNKIDLLKLDIEGSEIDVLNQMLDDEIYPIYLCIEFDLLLKKKDSNQLTHKLVQRLQNNNYKILENKNLNITFERM